VYDGIVTKSVHVERQAVQYVFEMEQELAAFHAVFGKTTTFSKWSCRPIVGESNYLQNLDIINVAIPTPVGEVKRGKHQGIIIHFDGKDIAITVHYHKFIYRNANRAQCPCPILQEAIAYSSTVAAANHAANVLQIDALFCVNEMILEVIAVNGDFVEAAVISPTI